MKGERRPPRHFDAIIESVLRLTDFRGLLAQPRKLHVDAVDSADGESEQNTDQHVPGCVQDRDTDAENSGGNRDLIWRDRGVGNFRHDPFFNRRVHKRREIENSLLCAVAKKTLDASALGFRWCLKRRWPHLATHRWHVAGLRGRIERRKSVCINIRADFGSERTVWIFLREPIRGNNRRSADPAGAQLRLVSKKRRDFSGGI